MRIAREEIFGPVLSVLPFDDDDEAIRIANDSTYGLGGAIYSRDTARAVEVAKRIRTGVVWINNGINLLDAPVRRLQGERHRPRGRPLGDGGVHRDPADHLAKLISGASPAVVRLSRAPGP